MKTGDQFTDLMKEITSSSSKIISKEFTLSDYYFSMADYFNQMEPSSGADGGGLFDFKKDAQEFIL